METDSFDGSAANPCYYSLLGIRRNASLAEIRGAYRKLALKWHPDRRGKDAQSSVGEAKRRFQRIQEAYSGKFRSPSELHGFLWFDGDASAVLAVLSDSGKRAVYDAGLFDPFDGDDQDFNDFMVEMLSMMNAGKPEKPDSLEDLKKIFEEMARGMELGREPSDGRNRTRVESSRNGGDVYSA